MPSRRDRLVWAAVLFRTIRPEVVEGAIIRRSERLHWSRHGAIEEVQEWVKDLPQIRSDDRIEWQDVEDNMSIGRFVNQRTDPADIVRDNTENEPAERPAQQTDCGDQMLAFSGRRRLSSRQTSDEAWNRSLSKPSSSLQ